MKQKIIVDNASAIKQLCQRYDVKTMHFFGSVCTDRFNEDSDIDVLISFKDIPIERYTDNYFELHEQLENLFKRKIDLLTDRSISNPYFRESVEETKELLYAT